jgi:Hsp20/alpha crystallin family
LADFGSVIVSKEKEEKDRNYQFPERAYGSFQRSFELPASVDRDKISADFSKGVGVFVFQHEHVGSQRHVDVLGVHTRQRRT